MFVNFARNSSSDNDSWLAALRVRLKCPCRTQTLDIKESRPVTERAILKLVVTGCSIPCMPKGLTDASPPNSCLTENLNCKTLSSDTVRPHPTCNNHPVE